MRALPDKPLNPPDDPPMFSKREIGNHEYGYCTADCKICAMENDMRHEDNACEDPACSRCHPED